VGAPRKYATDEERPKARRQSKRKYYDANREAIKARQAGRSKSERVAIEVDRKET